MLFTTTERDKGLAARIIEGFQIGAIVAVFLFVAAPKAFGAPYGLGKSLGVSERDAFLKELSEKQEGYDAISARVKEKKKFAMLSEVIETEGRIILKKPNLLYWEIESPERIIAAVNGKVMTIYQVQAGKARRVNLSTDFAARQAMRFFSAAITFSAGKLEREFDTLVYDQGESVVIELSPRSSIWKKHLGGVFIWFDKKSGAPERFVVDWKKRGLIETYFSEIELNPVVDTALFTLHLPDGVRVIESDFSRDEME